MDLISAVIRIHHNAIPTDLRDADADITAAKIEARMRDFGVAAEVSDVISHLKIELPTAHLANACAALVVMRLITPLNLSPLQGN
jgi:hypothetical protein